MADAQAFFDWAKTLRGVGDDARGYGNILREMSQQRAEKMEKDRIAAEKAEEYQAERELKKSLLQDRIEAERQANEQAAKDEEMAAQRDHEFRLAEIEAQSAANMNEQYNKPRRPAPKPQRQTPNAEVTMALQSLDEDIAEAQEAYNYDRNQAIRSGMDENVHNVQRRKRLLDALIFKKQIIEQNYGLGPGPGQGAPTGMGSSPPAQPRPSRPQPGTSSLRPGMSDEEIIQYLQSNQKAVTPQNIALVRQSIGG